MNYKLWAIFSILLFSYSWGELPAEIDLKVTYYDFHSNGSCPDFNPIDDRDTVTKSMVLDTLKNGVPSTGARVYFSNNVSKWFTPFSEHEDKNIVPDYDYDYYDENQHGRVETVYVDDHDTTYKNIVIEDSITLSLTNSYNGEYTFHSSAFFPLDGKGFGKEFTKKWDNSGYVYDHNYSFTMKMEHTFTYRSNSDMYFVIEGDDDVWVFINNKLVIDLGGIHAMSGDSINLKDLGPSIGLVDKGIYNIALFFAERQATASNLHIKWNFAKTNSKPALISSLSDVTILEDCNDTVIADLDTCFLDEGDVTYAITYSDSTLLSAILTVENEIQVTPKSNAFGELFVYITATDSEDLTTCDTFQLTVESVNDSPVLVIPWQDISLQEDFTDTIISILDSHFSDDDILSFSVTSEDSTLVVPVKNGQNQLILQSVPNRSGSSSVVVTATDTLGLSVADTFDVQVAPVNDTPLLVKNFTTVILQEDAPDSVVFTLVEYFNDDDFLTFTVTGSDSLLALPSITVDNQLLLHLKENAFGSALVIVKATDTSGLFALDTFDLEVFSVNDTPVLKTQLSDLTLPENCEDTLLIAMDSLFSDDDVLTYTISSSDSSIVVPFVNGAKMLGLYIMSDKYGSADIVVTAQDSGSLTVSDTFKVTVVKGNDVPVVVNPLLDILLLEDASDTAVASLPATFSDDGVLTFSATSLDSSLLVATVDSDKRLIISLKTNAYGEADIVVVAKDSEGLTVSDTSTITVQSVNDAPTLVSPIADITLNEDAPAYLVAELDTCFSDDDLLSFTVISTSTDYVCSIDSVKQLFLTCNVNTHGVSEIIVKATDSSGLAAFDTIAVTIQSVNDAPVLIGKLADVVVPFDAVSKTVAAVDTLFSDDGSLTYSVWSSDSSVVSGNCSGGEITLSFHSSGSAEVVVTALDDGGLSVSDTFAVVVKEHYIAPFVKAPVVDIILPVNSAQKSVGNLNDIFGASLPLIYEIAFSDSLLISAQILDDKNAVIGVTPSKSGVVSVFLTARDSVGGVASDTFTVTIKEEITTPVVINPIMDITVPANHVDTVIANAGLVFDSPTALTYALTSSDSTLVVGVLDLEKRIILNFMPNRAGEADIVLTVTNSQGVSASDTCRVTVIPNNSVPTVVKPVSDIILLKNSKDTTIAILAEVFSDDGPLKYRVSSGDEALVVCNLDMDSRLTLSFPFEAVGSTDIVLTATDDAGQVATDIFKVTINSVNNPPVLVIPFEDMVLKEDAPDTLIGDLTPHFADEKQLTFIVLSLDSSLVVPILDAKSILKLQIPPEVHGTTNIIINAIDDAGLTVADTFQLLIESVNDTPILIKAIADQQFQEDNLPVTLGDLSTFFSDDGPLQFTCTSSNETIIVPVIDSTNKLGLTFKPDAFGVVEVVVTATDAFNLSASDTFVVQVHRDSSDFGEIFDEDLGIVLKSSLFAANIAPNPLRQESSAMTIAIDHQNADRIEVVVLNCLGDELVHTDATIVSSEKAECLIGLHNFPTHVTGQSFAVFITAYKEGIAIDRMRKMIGLVR